MRVNKKQLAKKINAFYKKVNVSNLKKYKYTIVIGVFMIIVALMLFLVLRKPNYVSIADRELATLNSDIKNQITKNKIFNDDEIIKLADSLTKRKDILKEEFIDNPSLVNKYILDEAIKSKIPTKLSSLIETNRKISGSLDAIDTIGTNRESIVDYTLKYKENDKDKIAKIFLSDKEQYLLSVENVEAEGIYLDDYLLTSPEQVYDTDTNSMASGDIDNIASTSAVEEDRVLVIKLDFQDKKGGDIDSQIRSSLFGTVNSYYKGVSYGKYGLKEVAITDWITVPYSFTEDCNANYAKWSSDAMKQAYDRYGYNNSHYDRIIIQTIVAGCTGLTPGNGTKVDVAGYGSLGGKWSMYFGSISPHVYEHELGHNLGLHHASADYDCDAGGVCTWNEYGDPYDIMGKGDNFSLINRYKLGWVDNSRVVELTKSGRYTLSLPSQANLADPANLFLIKKLDGIKQGALKKAGAIYNTTYSYYEYHGSGSFIKRFTNTKNNGYTFLYDFGVKSYGSEKTYLSEPGKPISIGGSTIKIVSYDANKITFDIDSIAAPYKIEKIDIRAPYTVTGDKKDEYNYRITAGQEIDLGRITLANIINVGNAIRDIEYEWNNANNSGIFDSTKAGPYSVSASKYGVTSNIVKIMVSPAELSRIGISPNTPQEVMVNQPMQFTASGQDSYGNNTGSLTYSWTGTDANGLFVASKPGDYQVKVSGGGFESGIVNIRVKPAPLDHIIIDPDIAKTIEVGESVQFRAFGKDKYGNGVEGVVYNWVGTDANGLFTSKTPGTYQVKITSGEISSKEISVVVIPAPLDHIVITPNTTQTVKVGQKVQFTAQGQDQFNNNISGLTYSWTGADSNGIYTAKGIGMYIVKASSGSINSGVVNIVVEKNDNTVNPNDVNDTKETNTTIDRPVLIAMAKNGEESDIMSKDTVLLINDDKLSLSGTAPSGSTVTVFVGEKPYETTITADGNWKTEITSNKLDKGTYKITAQAKKGESSSEVVKIADAEVLGVSTKKTTSQDETKTTSNITEAADDRVSSIFDNPIVIGVVTLVNLAVVSGASFYVLRRYFNR